MNSTTIFLSSNKTMWNLIQDSSQVWTLSQLQLRSTALTTTTQYLMPTFSLPPSRSRLFLLLKIKIVLSKHTNQDTTHLHNKKIMNLLRMKNLKIIMRKAEAIMEEEATHMLERCGEMWKDSLVEFGMVWRNISLSLSTLSLDLVSPLV